MLMEKQELELYANTLVDQLILIKDRHKSELRRHEVDAINDICNLVSHNLKVLEKR